MRSLRVIGLLCLAAVATIGLVAGPVMAPALDADSADSDAPALVETESPVTAAEEATLSVMPESEPLHFEASPIDGVAEGTERVTLSVASSQPYALRVKAEGNLVNTSEELSSVGHEIPPTILRVTNEGSDEWQELSDSAVTLGEYPPTSEGGEATHTIVVQVFSTGGPGWDVRAGVYETGIVFEMLPVIPEAASSSE